MLQVQAKMKEAALEALEEAFLARESDLLHKVRELEERLEQLNPPGVGLNAHKFHEVCNLINSSPTDFIAGRS